MDQQIGMAFLADCDKMDARIHRHDWSSTPLGEPTSWPAALRTLVAVMLGSKQPMFVAWGAECRMLYNDGYAEILARKHPAALGRPLLEVWSEVYDDLAPIVEQAYAGESVHMDDITLMMERHGYQEETHFAFSYTPVHDESGLVAGIFCPCTETTGQVLADRRAAEASAALLRSEARNRQILDSALDYAIVATDLDGHVTRWNEGAHRVLGWSEAEMLGATADRFFTPNSMSEIRVGTETRSALKVEQDNDERWHQRKNGEHFWAVGRTTVLRDENKAAVGFVKVLRDQTEQHLAGEAERTNTARAAFLLDLEQQLRPASDAHEILTVAAEALGRRLGANQAAYSDIDAAVEFSIIEHEWNDGAMPSNAGVRRIDDFGPDFAADLRAGRTIVLTDAQTDPRTSAPTALAAFERLSIAALLTLPVVKDGKLVALFSLHSRTARSWTEREVSLAREVSERVWATVARARAEAELRVSEARLRELNDTLERQVEERTAELRLYRDIVQSDRSPVCAFDEDYRLIAFNLAHSDEFYRIFGHRVQLGEVFPDLFPPDQGSVIRAFMARALAGESYDVVEEFGDPELAKPYWEVSYYPLRDDAGRIIGAFHHAKDISSRLRAVAELAAAQEQLRQSQKMEAVGQLTGGLAHDFNNLLTGVTGSLELLQIRIAQGRIKEADRFVNAAQGAAKRAAALTQRLLAFSRRQTLDPKPTDLNRLVRGMEELISRTVGPEISLGLSVAAVGLWSALVDPGQLENALLNLCINARDAMPDGGEITIQTGNRRLDERTARELELPPGQYVSLCVSDTGTGMPPEIIARAFDPFFTTKPIGQGTGLGLSMIYGLVHQSGGQVRINSEVGRGTTVSLLLPRHFGEVQALDVAADRVAPSRARQGETVLVVDDEPTVRMLVTEVLEELGYVAIEAADGAAGLKVLQSNVRLDLLVTDVGLPGGMNGRQVADAARVARPGLKVLFITGYAETALLNHGHLDPGMHVLTKPFAMDVLADRIKELISTVKAEPASTSLDRHRHELSIL